MEWAREGSHDAEVQEFLTEQRARCEQAEKANPVLRRRRKKEVAVLPEEAAETVDHENWVGLRSLWYDMQCRRRSKKEIAQELDIDYIGAGNPVFDGAAGRRVLQLFKLPKTPVKALYIDFGEVAGNEIPVNSVGRSGENCLLVFEEPLPKRSYIISIDVAEGKEHGDWSIIKVLCRETQMFVATYFTHHDEVQLARSIKAVHDYYTTKDSLPWWACETNSLGLATFDLCVEIHAVPNAFMMPSFDSARQSISYRKGWWTSTVV